MTAHEFIDQLFERPQSGVASNMRYLTAGQLKLLENLIGQDEDGGAVKRGSFGGFVWMPRGRWKYVASQNPDGTRRALTRLNAGRAVEAGRLF